MLNFVVFFFFFQAEDGIRDLTVTGVQTCALPISGSEDEAASIARTLVDERLAACVNIIGPARSIYRWRGAVEDAREYLLLLKTSARLYTKVERRVRELHSYEVPEVVALPFAS